MSLRVITGIVVSDRTPKTIIVKVDRTKRHPIYSKNYLLSKKFTAHDEAREAKIGDKVQIIESTPISKTKRWRLQAVVEKAKTLDSTEAVS